MDGTRQNDISIFIFQNVMMVDLILRGDHCFDNFVFVSICGYYKEGVNMPRVSTSSDLQSHFLDN